MKYASVILDKNISKTLDYKIPENFIGKIKIGMRVEVPIKNSLQMGFVFELKNKTFIKNLKFISKIILDKKVPKDLFLLAIWMSSYYASSFSKIFKYLVPSSVKKNIQPKENIFLTLKKTKKDVLKTIPDLLRKYPLQAQVLELFLKSKKGFFLQDILKILNFSRSPIDSLIKKKFLKSKKLIATDDFSNFHEYFMSKPKILTEEQEIVLSKLSKDIENKIFKIHLLYGVTGSGKTEVYFRAIEKTLLLNKTVLVLIPEIALTTQIVERFKSRFKEKVAIIHHKRSSGEKTQSWKELLSGKIKIAIGTRSAIFYPISNLGLIIVDEEHDFSYKQTEDMPSFNAKNLAIVRAKILSCPILLGSATPSLESFFNAETKKYIKSTLLKRPKKAKLPKINIVDMKEEIKREKGFSYFSQILLSKIKERFLKGEQTILFLNRRGFKTFIFCPKCENSIKCPHCDISLTFHKRENFLLCHICGYQTHPIKTCPKCKSENCKYKGFGTEHVENSIKAIFPEIRTLRIDRDTTSKKNSIENLLKEFKAGKADVLIGTQMIVKGLHFPSVTLVGILSIDYILNVPDFRSQENAFQLITQVSGRAGREDLEGEVIIQTFFPENSTIKLAAKQDYLSFYKKEIESRKLFIYPPFSKMIKIIFSGKKEEKTIEIANIFRNFLIKNLSKNTQIYPIAKASLFKYKENFRFNLILKGKNILPLVKAIENTKKNIKIPQNIYIFIDVNPISLL